MWRGNGTCASTVSSQWAGRYRIDLGGPVHWEQRSPELIGRLEVRPLIAARSRQPLPARLTALSGEWGREGVGEV